MLGNPKEPDVSLCLLETPTPGPGPNLIAFEQETTARIFAVSYIAEVGVLVGVRCLGCVVTM